jgi:hypothetical protein
MLPDTKDLTFAEKQDLAFGLIKNWLGPLEIPGFGDDRRNVAIFPLQEMIRYGEPKFVGGYVNCPFKPFRVVVLETTRTWNEWVPAAVVPEVTKKTWWGTTRVVKPGVIIEPGKYITRVETIPRNHWSIENMFIGDRPQLLNGGRAVGGDFFAPDKACDYDFATAQCGHQIGFTVSHCLLSEKLLFRAVILGAKMRQDWTDSWKAPRAVADAEVTENDGALV